MTSVPWFRHGLRAARKQLKRANTREAIACWFEAIKRDIRIRRKRWKQEHGW